MLEKILEGIRQAAENVGIDEVTIDELMLEAEGLVSAHIVDADAAVEEGLEDTAPLEDEFVDEDAEGDAYKEFARSQL